MPSRYVIDSARHLVLSVASGHVVDAELVEHVRALRDDPLFDPSMAQVCDFRATRQLDIRSDTIRTIARLNPFGAGARRAIVVTTDYAFGMARMYQLLTDQSPDELHVFRSIDTALFWLGCDEDVSAVIRALDRLAVSDNVGDG